MGITQDTFNQYRDNAYEGQVANIMEADVLSRKVETAALPFGKAVVSGTGERSCAPVGGASTAADVIGFSVRTMAVENNSSDNAEYAIGEVASIIKRGGLFVKCGTGGASKDASVFVVINVAGGDAIGDLRGTADGANTIELNQVKWVDDVSADGIGEIVLNGILNA